VVNPRAEAKCDALAVGIPGGIFALAREAPQASRGHEILFARDAGSTCRARVVLPFCLYFPSKQPICGWPVRFMMDRALTFWV
jgi:hypothetical protein